MKKLLTLIISLFISYLTFAQVGFNYKALITDNGNPLSNTLINIRFTILNGNIVKYKEVHNGVSTDQHGIVSVAIGEGTPISGTFTHSLFRDFTLKLKVEIDTGSGWQDFGTEDLKLVPFAGTAHHLTTTDKVWIGSNTASGEKLWVKSEPSSGAELVQFYLENTLDGDDVLQLSMDAPPSNAQFLEAYIPGQGTVFRIDADGSILMKGDIKMANTGKITALNNSGTADLKAFVYGKVSLSGTRVPSNSSDGFTSIRETVGRYKVTFDNYTGYDYVVVVTKADTSAPRFITVIQSAGSFHVYIKNDSGNPADGAFNFVVFKR